MQQFLVDANVLAAAIKNPGKKAGALDLILEPISNEGICLVGNDLLLLEFDKYSEKFKSKTASQLIKRLKDKMKALNVDENNIKKCSKYFTKDNIVDTVHAATCFQEKSILVTNDKHFDQTVRTDFPYTAFVWRIPLQEMDSSSNEESETKPILVNSAGGVENIRTFKVLLFA